MVYHHSQIYPGFTFASTCYFLLEPRLLHPRCYQQLQPTGPGNYRDIGKRGQSCILTRLSALHFHPAPEILTKF